MVEFIPLSDLNKTLKQREMDMNKAVFKCGFCHKQFISFSALQEHIPECIERKEWLKNHKMVYVNEKTYRKTTLNDFGVF